MSVSIVTCPSCASLLLSDTVQCPTCLHVLDSERANDFPLESPTSEGASSRIEEPCPACGEMVRHGLVRCWNCGSFMREEIAETAQKLQEQAPDYRFNELPEIDEFTAKRVAADAEGTFLAGDDDFELSPEFAMQSGAGESAEAHGGDDETYQLSAPAGSAPSDETTDAPAAQATSGEATADAGTNAVEPSGNGAAPATGRSAPTEPEIDHSVATGGDALLKVALAELEEDERRRGPGGRRRRDPGMKRGGFLVYCPNGHRVEVQERHRGMRGNCPRCKAPFFVPVEAPQPEQPPAGQAAAEAAAPLAEGAPAVAAGAYSRWMEDIHLHVLTPQKLKIKAGSLKGAFDQVDLGFADEGLLIVQLAKKNSLFGAADKKKKSAAREAVRAHLAEGKPANEVTAVRNWAFDRDGVRQIAVVQPIVYAHESMFGGVPVFGDGRIAIRLPSPAGTTDLLFCSFDLTNFRELARHLAQLYGIENLGEDVGVPLADTYTELKCHYSEETLRALEKVEFYQADPNIKLKVIGRKCEACGLAVSEDSRKKEKIGGVNGKTIAKAKCPKCQKKFGNISLFGLDEAPKADAGESAESAEAAASESTGSGSAVSEAAPPDGSASASETPQEAVAT